MFNVNLQEAIVKSSDPTKSVANESQSIPFIYCTSRIRSGSVPSFSLFHYSCMPSKTTPCAGTLVEYLAPEASTF
jgi:hypothetical protein